jgi:cysteinyl-tRNA synthetase
MSTLELYNTLTKNKVAFKPIEEGKVKIYLCGPTVYDLLHIGNFRGAIIFNLVRNWLEKSGYEVTFVYNYTDVDDKIIKRANDEGVESSVISERYIAEFEKDFDRLGLKKHTHNPRVTDFMPQIITFVEDLIKRGVAYEVEGEVFYSIEKHEHYGCLSGKKLDELEAGSRVEVDHKKRSPFDFVLWKPSKAGEPFWESPWGKGRPGWHIECSAMIQTILGDTIDIHGGGIDLIFPHHENEIAQGEGRTGKTYCNHWMHNNFINLKEQKMSKSLGNVISARSFMDRYHPEILKYLMLSVHYRTMLNINEERIDGTVGGLSRIYSAIQLANSINVETSTAAPDKAFATKIKESTKKIASSLNDDFNTGEVIAEVFDVVRVYNGLNAAKKKKDPVIIATSKLFAEWVREQGQMMALFQENPDELLNALETILINERAIDVTKVEEIVEKRLKAREEKNYALSDELRDELLAMGIELQDGNPTKRWSVKI